MENQHRKISGYRELTEHEIQLINAVKHEGIDIQGLIADIEDAGNPDPRWIAIAKTDLQQGLMALTRAIAKPDFF